MKTVNYNSLIENFESFEALKGKCLLFDKESKFYTHSGVVTAALLDYDLDGKTILATLGHQWITHKLTRDELKELMMTCIEVVGNSEEDSYTLIF